MTSALCKEPKCFRRLYIETLWTMSVQLLHVSNKHWRRNCHVRVYTMQCVHLIANIIKSILHMLEAIFDPRKIANLI